MTPADLVHFVHGTPRRTRLKVPQRRRDRQFFASLKRRLEALSGVEDVKVSPETASVIVHHSPDFSWSSVRFGAMGLQPVYSGQPSVFGPSTQNTSADFIIGLVDFARALTSGRLPAHAVHLVITSVLEAVLETLLKGRAARG